MTAPVCRAARCGEEATHLVTRTDRAAGFGYVHDGRDGFVQDYYERDTRSACLTCWAHVERYTAPRRSVDTREVRVIALDSLMPETVLALTRGTA